jgi:hypothetical protein
VQFNVNTTDGPTDVEMKFHSPHTQESTSTGTAAIAAVILQHKWGKETNLTLYTMSLMYPQKKKSMGVKSALCEGQLIDPPLLIH